MRTFTLSGHQFIGLTEAIFAAYQRSCVRSGKIPWTELDQKVHDQLRAAYLDTQAIIRANSAGPAIAVIDAVEGPLA
jgi:hypothetical protein